MTTKRSDYLLCTGFFAKYLDAQDGKCRIYAITRILRLDIIFLHFCNNLAGNARDNAPRNKHATVGCLSVVQQKCASFLCLTFLSLFRFDTALLTRLSNLKLIPTDL